MKNLSFLALTMGLGFAVAHAQTTATKAVKPTAKTTMAVKQPASSVQAAHIYSPKADAKADLKAAISRAAKTNKHVFVQIGGNWCKWCIAFHDLVNNTSDLKKFLNDNYEVVLVNYSQENKNLPLLAELGYPQRFGFPVFLIVDAKGNVLHIENSSYLETEEKDANGKTKVGHDVKKIMAFLKLWTAASLDPKNYTR